MTEYVHHIRCGISNVSAQGCGEFDLVETLIHLPMIWD